MGTVYAAVHDESGEMVAIKVLSSSLCQEAHYRSRFQSEIESLRKLHHPHIVQIFGYGEYEGLLYFAMELVEGTNLQEELSNGRRYTWREAVQMGIHICEALRHAHDHGVIHRDLKPANLLLDADENIKLTDFGIAKLFGAVGMTADGGVLGTADYMSPEQAEGLAVNHRCDLYSLGSVLYAILAGCPPFTGETLPEVVHSLKYSDPKPIGQLVTDIPGELQSVIMQLLQKKEAQRIPTALAVLRRLRAIQDSLSIGSSPDAVDGEDRFELSEANTEEFPSPSEAISKNVTRESPNPEMTSPTSKEENRGEEDSDELSEAGMPSQTPTADNRFVSIKNENASSGRLPTEPGKVWPLWFQAMIPILILGLLSGVVFLLSRPPSADILYRRIKEATSSDDSVELLARQSDVDRFLTKYPEDPRRGEILLVQDEINREQRLRRLEGDTPLIGRDLLPVEAAYREAHQLIEQDPAAAAARFAAIIDLFGHQQDASPLVVQCVERSEKHLANIETKIESVLEAQRIELRRQLDRAAALSTSDPEGAERIWRGIIELYGDKSWAKSWVDEARESLSDL